MPWRSGTTEEPAAPGACATRPAAGRHCASADAAPPSRRPRAADAGGLAVAILLAALAGCATEEPAPKPPPARPADVRARATALLPPGVSDRAGWAADIQAAMSALRIAPTAQHLCAAIAVIEQESGFRADPPVPDLARIAWGEIDRRAERAGVPQLLVRAALRLPSPDGRSYAERIDAVRTERELSGIFEDMIGTVPLGGRLFGGLNPVRTGGPMQVGIAFAERHAKEQPYPYATDGPMRREVFTRRGGLYFGIAHLLGYPAAYDRALYRFADFNAGRYASRNAAFQGAVSIASGLPLALDGDLIRHGDDTPGSTELAVRSLADRLGLGHGAIRRALEQGDGPGLERTELYALVFELAERIERRTLPRAVVPRIALESPKITRKLSTEWFATRVDERYRRCLARGGATPG